MCFDFSISKAHSSVAKPKSIFFARATPIIFGSSIYAPAKFDAVVLQHPVYKYLYVYNIGIL